MGEVTKKIFDICLIVISAIGCFIIVGLVVVKGFVKLPTSLTATYATTVTDPYTGEVKPVLEASYWANKNGTGWEVVELRINAYSDPLKSALYSRGFQICRNKTMASANLWFIDNSKDGVFHYDSYDGESYETGHEYKSGDPIYVDVGGKVRALVLDGTYQEAHDRGIGGAWNGVCAFFTDWSRWQDSNTWYYYTTEKYTWSQLLIKMREIIISHSAGTGDGTISLIDLGDFLHIYDIDENQNLMPTPIGNKGFVNSYFTMQTHYDRRGMMHAKQSIFGSVGGDSGFNLLGTTDVEYWRAEAIYNLSEQDFSARYSAADKGYYYALPIELINELKTIDNLCIRVNFDIDKLNVKVLGFDYYALNGIEVDGIIINNTKVTNGNFTLQTGALKGTGLTSADIIKTGNVNLIDMEAA